MNLDEFQKINWRRAVEFFDDVDQWSALERAGEMVGEAGEAANVAKKMKRGWKGKGGERIPYNDADRDRLRDDYADELADTIITCCLAASSEGIDLSERVRKKFNEKSEQWGCDIRIP